MATSGWACLSGDLLGSIIDHIDDFFDFIRFVSTCQSWRSVALQLDHSHRHRQNLHLLHTCRNQLPMLMTYPTFQQRQAQDKPILYSVIEGVFYDVQFPISYSRPRFFGSSHGWLFSFDDECNRTSKIFTLINPFLNKIFTLPRFNFAIRHPCRQQLSRIIGKVALQFTGDDYEVLMDWGGVKNLAYLSSKNPTWVQIDITQLPVTDIISYKGQFYYVTSRARLIQVDVHLRKLKLVASLADGTIRASSNLLVESQEGDLLLVRRFTDSNPFKTMGIKVYKLSVLQKSWNKIWTPDKPDSGLFELEKSWVKMSTIGDQALFLGEKNSMSISTRDFPTCKPNCLYYYDAYFDISELPQGSDDDTQNEKEECIGTPYTPPCTPGPDQIWIVPYFRT